MFENCSVMVIRADEQSLINRVEVDAETQALICTVFSDAIMDLVSNKDKVEFDGRYKPERDDFLYIDNFQLADEIKDAIRDPMGVTAYKKEDGDYPTIKAIFVGKRTEEGDTEKFTVAFQRFRKEQYISASNINLFWAKNTFRREKEYGISISDSVDCLFSEGSLQFVSFFCDEHIWRKSHSIFVMQIPAERRSHSEMSGVSIPE